MAIKSDNIKGNPYHDEKTGKFTSEGVSAVNFEIDNKNKFYSDKVGRIYYAIKKYGIEGFISNSEESGGKNIRYYVDENLSTPLVMKYSKEICSNLLIDDIVPVTDDELDKIGVDIIGYSKEDLPLNEDNIYQCDFIDVKTSYHKKINISLFNAVKGVDGSFSLVSTWLLDHKKKATNSMIFNFIQDDISSNSDRVRELYNLGNLDDYVGQHLVSHEMYALDSQDIDQLVDNEISRDQLVRFQQEYASCFTDTGQLVSQRELAKCISRLGTVKRKSFNEYAVEMVSPATGFSISLVLNINKPFGDVVCSVNIPQRMMQKYYRGSRIV